ncbi:GspH/FimT family pseudopilin [Polynucleobacter sp. MWH-HuK1]|nr:GspH/FimT family pseudopilin [Polynucleobacter sp. MWH-HuK1]
MAVVLIIALTVVMSMPLLQEQIAAREIDAIARRFIAHAHFARQQALNIRQPVLLTPLKGGSWEDGWIVQGWCSTKQTESSCQPKRWFSQGSIEPVYFKGGGKQFTDPHSDKRGVLFNTAGAAKTGQGGFVANRLILGHQRAAHLERQMILGSGGRWRICDPSRDSKRCH